MQLVCVKKAPLDHIFIIQGKKKKEKLFERKEICYVIVVGRFLGWGNINWSYITFYDYQFPPRLRWWVDFHCVDPFSWTPVVQAFGHDERVVALVWFHDRRRPANHFAWPFSVQPRPSPGGRTCSPMGWGRWIVGAGGDRWPYKLCLWRDDRWLGSSLADSGQVLTMSTRSVKDQAE